MKRSFQSSRFCKRDDDAVPALNFNPNCRCVKFRSVQILSFVTLCFLLPVVSASSGNTGWDFIGNIFTPENKCPQVKGYAFQRHKDSPSGDLKNAGTDVEQLASECEKEAQCEGFNTDGFLKKQLKEQSEWTEWGTDGECKGLYVKLCEENEGYEFHLHKDSPLGDLKPGSGNVVQLASQCNQEADCEGFNTDGSLKKFIKEESGWEAWGTSSRCKGLYIKKCPEIWGYKFLRLKDSPLGDLEEGSGNVGQLATKCNRNVKCEGFNTDGYLKESIKEETGLRTWDTLVPSPRCRGLYIKDCPEIEGYDFHPNKDSPTGDLDNVRLTGGAWTFALDCDLEPKCHGFNTDGYLKNSIKEKSGWEAWDTDAPCRGLYVKRCYEVKGYEFHPGKDSPLGDWKHGSGNVALLASECDREETCHGFNTDGYLKNSTKPQREWSAMGAGAACKGLYTKVCTEIEGYKFHPHKDSPLGDLREESGGVEQLARECDKEEACQGFNTDGFLKKILKEESAWETWDTRLTCRGTYVKERRCPHFEGYKFYLHKYGGNGVSTYLEEEAKNLANMCNWKKDCKGFHMADLTSGALRNDVGPESEFVKHGGDGFHCTGLYVKVDLPCPAVEGYVFYRHKDTDIDHSDTNRPGLNLEALGRICSKDATCQSFNTDGWTRTSFGGQSELRAWHTDDRCAGVYVKAEKACPAYHGYMFRHHKDSPVIGQRWSTATLDLMCSNDWDCKGFNTDGVLKNNVTELSVWENTKEDDCQGLYIKVKKDCPEFEGYTLHRQKNSAGGDLKASGLVDVESLVSSCNDLEYCHGFNTEGYLKERIKPESEWNAYGHEYECIGLYTKDNACILRDGWTVCESDSARGEAPSRGSSEECAEVPRYTFFPQKRREKNFLMRKTDAYDLFALQHRCDLEEDCENFSTDGVLRSYIGEEETWDTWDSNDKCDGTYVKNWTLPKKCPEVEGYRFHYLRYPVGDPWRSNFREHGEDSATALASTCNNDCNEKGCCEAFTTFGELGRNPGPKSTWKRRGREDKCDGLYVAICAKIEGYDIYPNQISPLGTVATTYPEPPSVLAEWCTEMSDCRGFTSDGEIKAVIQEESAWESLEGDNQQDMCFYKKRTATLGVTDDVTCPLIMGYTFHRDMSTFSSEMQFFDGRSVFDMANWCDDDDECEGFDTMGWTTRRAHLQLLWFKMEELDFCRGMYVKNEVELKWGGYPMKDGYTFYFNRNVHSEVWEQGNGVKLQTDADWGPSKRGCDEGECQGFNTAFYLVDEMPQISELKELRMNRGWDGIYVKQNDDDPCPEVEGYKFYPKKESPGGNYATTDPAIAAAVIDVVSWCNKEWKCKGFTTSGDIKLEIKDEREWRDLWKYGRCRGMYVKL